MPSSSASYTVDTSATGVSQGAGQAQPMRRRYIDPATRDYVIEGGQVKRDRGLTSKVVLALGTRRGTSQLLPEFGSRLHLVKKADDVGLRQSEFYAIEALRHLSDELVNLDVVAVLEPGRKGAIRLNINYTLGDQPQTIPYSQPVSR